MTIPTNAVQTFAQIGIREDLSDAIMNISPWETPMMSAARKGTAKNRTPEWQRDRLRSPDPTNKAVEGDDVTGSSMTQPERLKNVVQLFDDVVIVSDTARAVNTAGRNDDLKYHVAKTGKAIKTDMEMRFSGNYSSVVGNSSTAGEAAGLEAWLTTNSVHNTGGSDGGFSSGTGLVTAATDGTNRTFTETLLKTGIANCWNVGGEATLIMMTGAKKQTASGFTGIATQFNQVNDQNKVMIYGAADIYKSDFGQHRLMPNRFVGAGTGRTATNGLFPGQTVLGITPSTLEIKFLQPFKVVELARTGHAEKRLLKCEATLAVKEERACFKICELS